jgi:cytochrome P450
MDDLDQLIATAVGTSSDPYTGYEWSRREQPIDRGMGYVGQELFTLYRHADIERVLRDPVTFSSKAYAKQIGIVLGPSILSMDGSEHVRHRAIIGGAFRRTVLADWETTLMAPTVHGLIDRFAARGSAELVRELTIQFPIRIIATLLGIPVDDFDRFMRLSIQLISIMGDVETGLRASAELRDYFAGIVEERRADPTDDVISTLVHAEVDGQPLDEEEIYGFLRLLLPAGAETTYRLLGSLLFALLNNPAQLDAVRTERALLPAAIEEALRWESPVQYVDREATVDVSLHDVTIPAGAQVSLCLGSANHDETVFEDPATYDLFKVRAPHVAFADGPHRCLGEHLARLETTVAMNAVLDRLPDLRLDPDAEAPSIFGDAFRSPNRLPIVFKTIT